VLDYYSVENQDFSELERAFTPQPSQYDRLWGFLRPSTSLDLQIEKSVAYG